MCQWYHRQRNYLSWPLKYQYWEAFFSFRVLSLFLELMVWFKKYSTVIFYPGIHLWLWPNTQLLEWWCSQKIFGEKYLGSYSNTARTQEQCVSTLTWVSSLLGWLEPIFSPCYTSAFTLLCLFHCRKTQNVTFSRGHCLCEKYTWRGAQFGNDLNYKKSTAVSNSSRSSCNKPTIYWVGLDAYCLWHFKYHYIEVYTRKSKFKTGILAVTAGPFVYVIGGKEWLL